MLKRTVVQVHPYTNGADVPLDKPLYDPDGNVIPDWFDPRKLTGLSRTGTAWFDETHLDVQVRTEKNKTFGNGQVQVRFPRKDGQVVSEGGKYSEETEKKCA